MAVQKEREKVTKEELGEEILKFSEPHLLFRREKKLGFTGLGREIQLGKCCFTQTQKSRKKLVFKVVRIVSSGGFWGFSAGS